MPKEEKEPLVRLFESLKVLRIHGLDTSKIRFDVALYSDAKPGEPYLHSPGGGPSCRLSKSAVTHVSYSEDELKEDWSNGYVCLECSLNQGVYFKELIDVMPFEVLTVADFEDLADFMNSDFSSENFHDIDWLFERTPAFISAASSIEKIKTDEALSDVKDSAGLVYDKLMTVTTCYQQLRESNLSTQILSRIAEETLSEPVVFEGDLDRIKAGERLLELISTQRKELAFEIASSSIVAVGALEISASFLVHQDNRLTVGLLIWGELRSRIQQLPLAVFNLLKREVFDREAPVSVQFGFSEGPVGADALEAFTVFIRDSNSKLSVQELLDAAKTV